MLIEYSGKGYKLVERGNCHNVPQRKQQKLGIQDSVKHLIGLSSAFYQGRHGSIIPNNR